MTAKFHIGEPFNENFSMTVRVDSEGWFRATIPAEIVLLFNAAGLHLPRNRRGNEGAVDSQTLAGLKEKVGDALKMLVSRKEVERTNIIRYTIETTCAYGLTPLGDFQANALGDAEHASGTKEVNSCRPSPFGFQFWAHPYEKVVMEFVNGKQVVEYKSLREHNFSVAEPYTVQWLASLMCIVPVEFAPVQEVPLTPDTVRLFCSLAESVFSLNERIKGLAQDPEELLVLAQNQGALSSGAFALLTESETTTEEG